MPAGGGSDADAASGGTSTLSSRGHCGLIAQIRQSAGRLMRRSCQLQASGRNALAPHSIGSPSCRDGISSFCCWQSSYRSHATCGARRRSRATRPREWQAIQKDSLEAVPSRELFDGAMRGMVDVLHKHGDPHSQFLNEAEANPLRSEIHQQFGGIGIRIGFERRRASTGDRRPARPRVARRTRQIAGGRLHPDDRRSSNRRHEQGRSSAPLARRSRHDRCAYRFSDRPNRSRARSSLSAS